MALSYYTTLRNTIMAAVASAVDNDGAGAGTLRVYSGTVPADVNVDLTTLSPQPTLLSEHTCSNPTEASITAGVLQFDTIADDSSANAGSSTAPTFARFVQSGGTEVIQMTAGVGSGDLNFDGSITAGQNVSIGSSGNGGSITEGNE